MSVPLGAWMDTSKVTISETLCLGWGFWVGFGFGAVRLEQK